MFSYTKVGNCTERAIPHLSLTADYFFGGLGGGFGGRGDGRFGPCGAPAGPCGVPLSPIALSPPFCA